MNSINSFLSKFGNELAQACKQLDGTGWAIASGILLVAGWFFLKGKKIKAA